MTPPAPMEPASDAEREARRAALTEKIVRQIEILPPMPETALRLRKAASDPNADFARIVPLIEKDPGLCADLLHYANSAAYGVGHPVETMGEAVFYFGMDNLVEYILVSYTNRLVRRSFGKLRHLEDYFAHSEQVSRACSLLAQHADLSLHDQEVCKVAGLLHNIGKLVLLLATQQWGGSLMTHAPWSDRQAMVTAEDQSYGLNHCEAGAKLCQKWRFPDRLLDAIRHHHRPLQGGRLVTLAAFVYLGELMVIDDLPMEIILRDFTPDMLAQMRLTEEKLALARKAHEAAQGG